MEHVVTVVVAVLAVLAVVGVAWLHFGPWRLPQRNQIVPQAVV
jgi:hypothetical protein